MSFAGNPMRYLLSPSGSGGGGLPMGGVLAVIQMEFTGIDTTPDHSVDVTFLDGTRTFILKSECTDRIISLFRMKSGMKFSGVKPYLNIF